MDTKTETILHYSAADLAAQVVQGGGAFRSWAATVGVAFAFTIDGVTFGGFEHEGACYVYRAPGWRSVAASA